MSLHKDLLDQARHLAKREPKRPKQASLRRAVSAAYCALFHLLIDAASRFMVRGNNRADLRYAVTRAFDHGEMKSAANTFKAGEGRLPHGSAPTEEARSLTSWRYVHSHWVGDLAVVARPS